MFWAHRILLIVVLVSGATGCSHWRDDLVEERAAQEQRKAFLQGYMDRNDPPGSRSATHPDTKRLLDEVNQSDARIREIDRELRK